MFGVGSLHLSKGMVDVDALIKEVSDVPAFSVLQEESSAVVVGALNDHTLVGIATKFLIDFIVSEVKLN